MKVVFIKWEPNDIKYTNKNVCMIFFYLHLKVNDSLFLVGNYLWGKYYGVVCVLICTVVKKIIFIDETWKITIKIIINIWNAMIRIVLKMNVSTFKQ